MNLLLFGDIHRDLGACEAIVRRSREADLVIGVGDYALFRKGLRETMAPLSRIAVPTLLVHGNHESTEELAAACVGWKQVRLLHGNSVRIGSMAFFGLGGATPLTPFGSWSVDIPEEEAARLLDRCPPNAALISHSPPFRCLDRIADDRFVGSRAVRRFVETRKPPLVVCGHIHESAGQRDLLAGVPVVNPGPGGILLEGIGPDRIG